MMLPRMVAAALAALSLGACKKQTAQEPPPPGGGPADRGAASPPASASGVAKPPLAGGTEGSVPATPDAGPADTARPTPAKAPPVVAEKPPAATGPEAGHITPPPLPKLGEGTLLGDIHDAETACTPGQSECAALDRLAARIVAELEAAEKLLGTGTDGQKRALRAALLRSRSPLTDRLLVGGLVGASGMLDTAVLAHVMALRTPLAVPPLVEHLKKALGPEVRRTIDALSALGAPTAVQPLLKALDDPRLAAYRGDLCRALSRLGASEHRAHLAELARRAGAIESQVVGCGGADAAFRAQASGGGLVANMDGRQLPGMTFVARQLASDPLLLVLQLVPESKARCDVAPEPGLRIDVPLDRQGQPIVGSGLLAAASNSDQTLGTDGLYWLGLRAAVLEKGGRIKGTIHFAHTARGAPRIIVSGHFDARYCGVTAPAHTAAPAPAP